MLMDVLTAMQSGEEAAVHAGGADGLQGPAEAAVPGGDQAAVQEGPETAVPGRAPFLPQAAPLGCTCLFIYRYYLLLLSLSGQFHKTRGNIMLFFYWNTLFWFPALAVLHCHNSSVSATTN